MHTCSTHLATLLVLNFFNPSILVPRLHSQNTIFRSLAGGRGVPCEGRIAFPSGGNACGGKLALLVPCSGGLEVIAEADRIQQVCGELKVGCIGEHGNKEKDELDFPPRRRAMAVRSTQVVNAETEG